MRAIGIVAGVLVLFALEFGAWPATPIVVRAAQDQPALDPTALLPAPEELPADFVHQPHYDRTLVDAEVTRVVRFYTRGAPELPSDVRAALLLSVAVSDSPSQAEHEFEDAVQGWGRMGYRLSPLAGVIGDEAVAGQDAAFFVGTDYPKQGALVQFRSGVVTASVQWTDNPGAATVEQALEIARRIEARI